MNGILAAQTLKEIPYCIVDESLWIGWIQLRKRENSGTRACGSADRGRLEGVNGFHGAPPGSAAGSMLGFRQVDHEPIQSVRQCDLAGKARVAV
jgi:hypothetical protein